MSGQFSDTGTRALELDLFGDPVGALSLRPASAAGDALCVGRQRWTRPNPGPASAAWPVEAQVCRSVLTQVRLWMIANAAASDVATMRRLNTSARACQSTVDRQMTEARRLMRSRNPVNWLRGSLMMQGASEMIESCGNLAMTSHFTMGRAGHPDGDAVFDRLLDVFLGGRRALRPQTADRRDLGRAQPAGRFERCRAP